MVGQAQHLVVGVVEGLGEQPRDVGVGRRVVGECALSPHAHQSGPAQLREVLGDRRGRGTDQVGQARDRGLPLEQGPQELDAGGVREQPEGVAGRGDPLLRGHLEVPPIYVHAKVMIHCRGTAVEPAPA